MCSERRLRTLTSMFNLTQSNGYGRLIFVKQITLNLYSTWVPTIDFNKIQTVSRNKWAFKNNTLNYNIRVVRRVIFLNIIYKNKLIYIYIVAWVMKWKKYNVLVPTPALNLRHSFNISTVCIRLVFNYFIPF